MGELSERKEKILQAVVIEHVTSAEPVASELIAQRYDLGVRSATVRNEMAEITEMGFLEQPHTSAGRVPSDTGYRYYVDRIATGTDVTADEQGKIKSASRDEETLKDLVSETTRVLSRLTRTLTAALTVRDAGVRVMHAILTALGPERGLLVLVLQNGHVENRLVDLPIGMTLEDMGFINEIIVQQVVGHTLAEVSKIKVSTGVGALRDKATKAAILSTQAIAKDLTRGYLVTEGEEFILAQPEFVRSPDALQALVSNMQEEASLIACLTASTAPTQEGSHVSIGKENLDAAHQQLSVVKQRFFVGSDEAGTLAIIGPTRMNYDRNMAMLEFTADAISQTLTKLFT